MMLSRTKQVARNASRLAVVAGFLASCAGFIYYGSLPPPTRLEQIRAAGEITVVLKNNPHCYYLHRNQSMGFEYDLARAFADDLGVHLNVLVMDQWQDMLRALRLDRASIIAANLKIWDRKDEDIIFTKGYMPTRRHLVVHRKNRTIRTAADLEGKTVHLHRGPSHQKIADIFKTQGIHVTLKVHDEMPIEELIRQVADRKIEATLADHYTALLNRRYFPQIIVASAIDTETWLGWAVRPDAVNLRDRINAFFQKIQKDGRFEKIFNRYYGGVEQFDYVDLRAYHRRLSKRLPLLEAVIKSAAAEHGFDWRLIAAQIYQESHFDPRAVSPAGAVGLMQLTERTARSLGVADPYNPEENIWAGVRHLKDLYDFFSDARDPDRVFIALAAYNTGMGHIQDARRLARRKNLDPNRWATLSQALMLLMEPKYYRHARYGYCRATEPIRYLKQIRLYYDILKRRGVDYQSCDPYLMSEIGIGF